MRSAKEAEVFPYSSKVVCYMELFPNGEIHQLSTEFERVEAYFNAKAEKSKILAVWPGRWRSDLFIIDDLDSFFDEQNLKQAYERYALAKSY